MATAIMTPKRDKPHATLGRKTKEEIRGLPPSKKTLAQKTAATGAGGKFAQERADVARTDAAKK